MKKKHSTVNECVDTEKVLSQVFYDYAKNLDEIYLNEFEYMDSCPSFERIPEKDEAVHSYLLKTLKY